MDLEDNQALSPLIAIYLALRAIHPKWDVEIGQPHGPGWLPGTALTTANEGPFQALLARIGERLQTADRRTIAASFALRYGWSAGVAMAPYILYHCVPTIALNNVSFKFHENTAFEQVALHHPEGVMLLDNGVAPHPSMRWLSSPPALLAWLRRSLVQQAQVIVDALYAWSHFAVRGIWGMITSAWSSLCIHIFGEIGQPTHALSWLREFFHGDDVTAQMQPQLYSLTSQHITRVYQCGASCCRYYLVRQGQYCASCPLISDDERLRRQRAHMHHLIVSQPSARAEKQPRR
jgi:FhuF 2Fe-2S C-terminal domain